MKRKQTDAWIKRHGFTNALWRLEERIRIARKKEMKVKYQTDDGIVLQANSPEEVVQQLHEISLAPAEDDAAWMEEVAKRTFQATGKTLRWGTAADFVTDMLSAGLLKEIKS